MISFWPPKSTSSTNPSFLSHDPNHVWVVPLLLCRLAYEVYELEGFAKVGKLEGLRLLRAIEEAFARIRQGTYGVCVVCNQRIAKARLEAVPWTRVCRECTERQAA